LGTALILIQKNNETVAVGIGYRAGYAELPIHYNTTNYRIVNAVII
jgi:hypothetical protein